MASSMKLQCGVNSDLTDNFCVITSSSEDEKVCIDKKSKVSIIKNKKDCKIIKKETKREPDDKENHHQDSKNSKNPKKKNKDGSSGIKKPTFKMLLKTVSGKSILKRVEKEKAKKNKASAVCKKKVVTSTANSATDTKSSAKKDQNHEKVETTKKKLPNNIFKPDPKKFKLQVGKSSVAVPVREENKKLETSSRKISKKLSKAKSTKSTLALPEPKENTGNESVLFQNNIKNHTLSEICRIQKSKKSPPSMEEDAKNKKVQSESKSKPRVLNEMRQRLTKNLGKTLTFNELEEICTQKVCEAIIYKSEIGELRDQLRMQEEKSKKFLTEVQELSARTQNLKLMNEHLIRQIQSLDAARKPLLQIKITRSVALQVKPTSLAPDE